MTRFLIKPFGTEAVVFDIASGDTHYLSPLAYTLLNHTQSGSAAQDIPAALARAMQMEHDSEFEQQAVEAIASLQRIGLIGQA